MKTAQRVLLVFGTLTLLLLLWRIDVGAVRFALLQVGWGMALVVGQETVAHLFNALGWRFAFSPDHAASFPLTELVRVRVAGDAINYLTPSATIAGEVARTAMLNDTQGTAVRAASVVLAKSTQTLGQVLFAASGLVLLGAWRVVPRPGPELLLYGIAGAIMIAAFVVYRLKPPHPSGSAGAAGGTLHLLQAKLRRLFHDHPGRVALSTLMFVLGYAWGTFEAYWICRFLLVPVPIATALTIEVLSVTVDGIFFFVPAKIATQEGGKMAIFSALDLSPSLGFAFGVVRHIRELTWAGFGVLLCWAHHRTQYARVHDMSAEAEATGLTRIP